MAVEGGHHLAMLMVNKLRPCLLVVCHTLVIFLYPLRTGTTKDAPIISANVLNVWQGRVQEVSLVFAGLLMSVDEALVVICRTAQLPCTFVQ